MMIIPLAVEARVESRPDFPEKMHLRCQDVMWSKLNIAWARE